MAVGTGGGRRGGKGKGGGRRKGRRDRRGRLQGDGAGVHGGRGPRGPGSTGAGVHGRRGPRTLAKRSRRESPSSVGAGRTLDEWPTSVQKTPVLTPTHTRTHTLYTHTVHSIFLSHTHARMPTHPLFPSLSLCLSLSLILTHKHKQQDGLRSNLQCV